MRQIIIILTAILSVININAHPKYEIRAAWIATENGIDWPCGIYEKVEQQETFCTLLDKLAAININTIYLQMQVGGAVAWESSYMPPMSIITGDGSLQLPYDVANFVIDECHKRNIECHAWLVPFKIGYATEKNKYLNNKVKHILSSYPELCITYNGIYYIDPGIPVARKFIYETYKEMVSDYKFDGINLDLTCYQGLEFGDTDSFFEYNPDYLNKEDWRRANLNTFISELSEELKQIDSDIKIGTSPIGAYKPIVGYENQTAYNYTYQDPCAWLNNGWIDYISPKMFHTEKNGFSKNLAKWLNESSNGNIIIGISSDMLNNGWDFEVLVDQIEKIRENSADGIAIYSAGSLISFTDLYLQLQNNIFYYPAHIVPNNGTYANMPNAPRNVTQEFINNGYQLIWDAPESSDIRYYSIYLANDNNVDLTDLDTVVAAKVGNRNFFYSYAIDDGLQFAITAFDKNYNESNPAYATITLLDDISIYKRFIYHQGILYISDSSIIDRIEIYTLTGTKVRTEFVNNFEASIDCSTLGQGVFVARAVYQSGASKIKKIIR